MKTRILFLICLPGAVLLGGCGGGAEGGTEFGNPTRSLVGRLATSNVGRLATSIEGTQPCPADTVIATEASGETSEANVKSDCTFSLPLTPNRSYVISYALEEEFVATLVFQNSSSSSLTSLVLFISSGSTRIDLGTVTVDNGQATAEKNPVKQNDRDGDGENDFDDNDDDEDGLEDEDEEDCDEDGHLDDDDESDCEDEEDEEDGEDEDDENDEEENGDGDEGED